MTENLDSSQADAPDRHRLNDLVRLTFDEAQAAGADGTAVTDQQVADAGPYSLEQVREHLVGEEDAYELERDGDALRVVGVTQLAP